MRQGMYILGTTPEDVLSAALGKEPYTMELIGEDAVAVEVCVNQGIDAHLTACFVPDRGDSFAWAGWQGRERLVCIVSPESMLVLLRRLHDADTEEAWSLRSSILTTLDIEEV